MIRSPDVLVSYSKSKSLDCIAIFTVTDWTDLNRLRCRPSLHHCGLHYFIQISCFVSINFSCLAFDFTAFIYTRLLCFFKKIIIYRLSFTPIFAVGLIWIVTTWLTQWLSNIILYANENDECVIHTRATRHDYRTVIGRIHGAIVAATVGAIVAATIASCIHYRRSSRRRTPV